MIKYDYEITVNGNQAKLNKDIYLFRGNKNVHYYFAVKNASFNFKGSTDLIEKTNAINAAVTVIKPNNVEVASAIAKVENGKIHLKVTEDLIDEEVEVGDFDLVFDLFDDTDGAVTIPKVIGQFHVLERPCTTPISELVATNTTNEVDQALTDYAIVTYAEPVASTNADGTFAKKTWVPKEKITTAELNRMEEGIAYNNSQYKDIANLFSTEQTETFYKIKCDGKVIATIPIGNNTQVTTYFVSNTLTNCSTNNTATVINENSSYTATISANSGYTLSSVTVTMGGADITSSCYSEGTINISTVTGNIVITANANKIAPTPTPTNPLTNLIVDIKEDDYYLDSSDSLYKMRNNATDEIVIAYTQQSLLNPFRTFPSGAFTNTLTTAGTTFQNLTGAVSFIYDEARSSAKITHKSKIQEFIKFINEFNTTWNNYTSKADGIPYINTNGESVTYTSDEYKKDIIPSNEWNRVIMTTVLEEDGKINNYLNNELVATIPTPSDFSRWDYIAMSDGWNELKLYEDNLDVMVKDGVKINVIVRQGSTSLEEIKSYQVYSEEQSVSLTNNISSLALEEGDHFF